MTAAEFVNLTTELIFLAIFVVVVARAIRLRTGPSVDTVVFFGLIVLAQWIGNLVQWTGMEDTPVDDIATLGTLAAMPYLLLRLANHFAPQRRWAMTGALAVTLVVGAVGILSPKPLPNEIAALLVGWFVIGGGAASLTFVREAARTPGVTGRRLLAAALGSTLIAVGLLVALLGAFVPAIRPAIEIIPALLIAAGGVAYYVAFATPEWLRNAWQEPTVRAFLGESAALTGNPDEIAVIRRLEQLAAEAMGGHFATIGRPTADGQRLIWLTRAGEVLEAPADQYLGGRAYATGRPVFSTSPAADDPDNAAAYEQSDAETVIAAPMVAGGRSYGSLVIAARRRPLFALSDIGLTQVLAQHAGSILQSRQLLHEAAQLQAREAATRAKEDFLSAAAHDLRTPLSSMILRLELLLRRLRQEGSPHLPAVEATHVDATRVTEFVSDLLDAARSEQGRLSTRREPVDLLAMATDVAREHATDAHDVQVRGEPVTVEGDARRLNQVLANLVSNAIKYTPGGGTVEVEVCPEAERAVVRVMDRGIGIDEADQATLFSRFSRGRNVDDRRYSGLGLGLYICRRIVEEHEGAIDVTSAPGKGSTFTVSLPLRLSSAAGGDVPHG
jgi:signal transduction histidine kinase